MRGRVLCAAAAVVVCVLLWGGRGGWGGGGGHAGAPGGGGITLPLVQTHNQTAAPVHVDDITTKKNVTSQAPPASPSKSNDSVPLVSQYFVSGHSVPHAHRCRALGKRTKLVILISSAPSHAIARHAVRRTWGNAAARSDIAMAFMLGEHDPNNATLGAALQAEDELYGDLIRGRFIDSYSNLTLKTLSALEWTLQYCPRAPFLLKTDDDMFVNVDRLLQFAAARVNATRTVWGRIVRKSAPRRQPNAKYYVPKAQFAGARFPDFATGPAYLVSRDAIPILLSRSLASRWLRLEDVLVTGVAAAAGGVARVAANEFVNRRAAPRACALRRLVALHMLRPHEQLELWRRLHDDQTKCPDH